MAYEMDESDVVIKAEIVDNDENVQSDIELPFIKTEPIETEMENKSEDETNENARIPTELNSDLVLMIINLTIANSSYKDINAKLFTHKNLPGSYSIVIIRDNFHYFPRIPTLNPTNKSVREIDNDDNASLDELEKKELEKSELHVVENPFRIVISGTTLKASFQAFGKEKFTVANVIEWNGSAWKVSEDFLTLLGYLSRHGDGGVFRVCEGIQDEDIRSNNDVSVTSLSLVTITTPFPRYESPNCSIVQPAQYKNKCPSCLKWYANLRGYRKRKLLNTKDREFSDTDVSSTTKIGILSPERLRERLSNIQTERKCLYRRVKSLEEQLRKLEKKLEKNADSKKAKKKQVN